VEKRSLSYGVKAAPDPIEESAVNREYFPAGYFVRTQPRRLTDEDAVPELQVTPTFDARGSLDPRSPPTPRSRRDRLWHGHEADGRRNGRSRFQGPALYVDYEGYIEERLKIKGDRMSDADFKKFLKAAFFSHRTVVKPGASNYVCHSSSCSGSF
jgi:hypothetical protein